MAPPDPDESIERRRPIVEAIADQLSLQILRGDLAPGTRLPSVRALAKREEVNVSTVQRVLVRLEERGLVQTLDRAGVEVRDPAQHAGASLWVLALGDARGDRDRAVRLLEDVLETRRWLALRVVQVVATQRERVLPALVTVVDRLEAAIRDPKTTLPDVAEADLEVTRVLLRLADKPALLAVFNDVAAVIRSLPVLRQAFYGKPDETLEGWRLFITALSSGSLAEHPELVSPLMESADTRALAAFTDAFDRAHAAERPTPRGGNPT